MHDRRGLGVGVEIEGAPARPFAVQLPALLALLGGRIDASPRLAMRSIISMQMPRDGDLVAIVHMSSSTSTMPPEARPPR